MPTVFYFKGNNEPVHIHLEKAEASAKFWLHPNIEEVYSYGFTGKERKEIRSVIDSRYQEIINSWNEHFRNKEGLI